MSSFGGHHAIKKYAELSQPKGPAYWGLTEGELREAYGKWVGEARKRKHREILASLQRPEIAPLRRGPFSMWWLKNEWKALGLVVRDSPLELAQRLSQKKGDALLAGLLLLKASGREVGEVLKSFGVEPGKTDGEKWEKMQTEGLTYDEIAQTVGRKREKVWEEIQRVRGLLPKVKRGRPRKDAPRRDDQDGESVEPVDP